MPSNHKPGDGLAVVFTIAIALAAWMFYLFLLAMRAPNPPCN